MIKIESVRESHGPISGSPVEGSGILFVLQGVLTSEDPEAPTEGYFHAIPLDVFSELVLTQGFSPDDVEGMARRLMAGSDAPEDGAKPDLQDPDPILLEMREQERVAVSQELQGRQSLRARALTDLNESSPEYWEEVANISDFLTKGSQSEPRASTERRSSLQGEYRARWSGLGVPGHDLDENSTGWRDFLTRVKERLTEREKGVQALVHQRYGDMILRSLTEKTHVLESIPLPSPLPDPRISPTGQEPHAEEDGLT